MKTRVSLAAVAAVMTSLFAAVPALAQTTADATTATSNDNGGLLWVWVWILVIGVIAIVGGASVGNMRGK